MNWYAVHVKSRHEFKVHDHLSHTGLESFLPTVDRLSRWKDRKKLVSFPLFSSYLFVHIHNTYEEKLTVLKKPGVVRLLGNGTGEPIPVPDEQVTSLQSLVTQKRDLDPYPYLKEGDRIRIKKGPLAGLEGILIKKADQHRLILSIDIIQKSVSVQIDASEV